MASLADRPLARRDGTTLTEGSGIRQVEVPAALAGWRVDRALSHLLGVSRTRLDPWFEAGAVRAGGRVLAPSARVAADSVVELPEAALAPPAPALAPLAERAALDVVYEDDDLLVVNKPAGLVVHPAPGHPDHTLVNALLGHAGTLAPGQEGRPGIVHRLDKDTSGLIVVAKSEAARSSLMAAIAAHAVERTYVAIVRGRLPAERGRVDAALGRHPVDRKRQTVRADGRRAVTHFSLLEQHALGAVAQCRLETGRTHQIRVHLAHIGCPVACDPLYGSAADRRGPGGHGQLLHAAALVLHHPRDGREMRFDAPWPNRLLLGRERLRRGEDPCPDIDRI